MRQFEHSGLRRLTAVFVVLLVASVSFLGSVHQHDEFARSGAVHSHCALCIFSHSPAAVTATRSAPVPVRDVAELAFAEPQLRSRLLIPSAFIRPPPVL